MGYIEELVTTIEDACKHLPSEREKIHACLDKVINEKQGEQSAKSVRPVVPVRKWLSSPYYLGDMAKDLYPFWKNEIEDFIENGYNEWIMSGGIGTGKTTAAAITAIRKIYETSCYDVPQRLFHIADVTNIFFAYFSVNQQQAELTGFGQLRQMIDNIPYFRENFRRDSGIDSVLKFPSGIVFISGSDILHVAGMNLLCAILDESNFYRSNGRAAVGDLKKATDIYSEVTDRRRSRFLFEGNDPGFSLLVSSSTNESSFTSSRIKTREEDTKVTIARPWFVKPAGTYSKKRFFVFEGSKRIDPFIVNQVSDIEKSVEETDNAFDAVETAISFAPASSSENKIREALEKLPFSLSKKFIDVPVDFKSNFVKHIYTALRNLAGVALVPGGKLFNSRAAWHRCKTSKIEHPFTKNEICVSVSNKDTVFEYFKLGTVFRVPKKLATKKAEFTNLQLKLHPSEPRFIHIDQSTTTDATGIACVHKAGYRVDDETGLMQPILCVDFVLRILPPAKPDKISIAKIRRFVFDLRSFGMIIGYVSYDQHQSEDSLQILKTHGIKAGRISTDKSDKIWIDFCNLIYERRLLLYDFPILEREFFSLDHDDKRHKVEHPLVNDDGTPGSKDVCDGIVGACSSCLQHVAKGGTATASDKLAAMEISMAFESETRYDPSWILTGSEYNEDQVPIEVEMVNSNGLDQRRINRWI